MSKYVAVTLLSACLALTFTVGLGALTGINVVKPAPILHKDVLVKAPTFDLLPPADF
jgi:hypothetical protein